MSHPLSVPMAGQASHSPRHTIAEALDIVGRVADAQTAWRRTPVEERARLMRVAAGLLRQNGDAYVALMTSEMGKTDMEGRAEVQKCAWVAEYFAEHAAGLMKDRLVDMSEHFTGPGPVPEARVTYQPLGVILAVMPWNFPFWQVMRFAIPHLLAGNGGVLKHAANVSGCAKALENLFRQAGFPENLFRAVFIPGHEVHALIEDDRIAAVSFTGSVAAGRAVAAAAGGVVKKAVLELGGSDAYVVLEDADIEAAAKICAAARMKNSGQSCDAGKRFIVVDPVREAFERAFVDAMRDYEMGDPADPRTRLGPMVSVAARDEIANQVRQSVARGARVLLGGDIPDRPGAWYPATVLCDVRPGQPAYDDEVFGPVAAIIAARDEADAIRIANDSRFGLGAVVLTTDLERGERIAIEELDAGSVYVNQIVRSDPRLPFGGVKQSGYGRELADIGMHEFCNIKSVILQGLPGADLRTHSDLGRCGVDAGEA